MERSDRSNLLRNSCRISVKILFSKIFVRISFLKRFIEVEALLGLSKALIRFIHQPQT
jgi:hypothetical protein